MKKVMFYMAAAAVALISCTNEETVDVDDSGTIKFRAVMGAGANSRGIETKTENLNEFKVCGVVEGQSEHYIEKQTFTKNGGLFTSSQTYRWPEKSVVDFYAYTYYPGKTGETDNKVDYTKLNVSLGTGSHTISDFTPEAEIAKQIDPVTAYAYGDEYQSSVSGVELEFNHMLSKILINAKSASSVYEFHILGARIANIKSKGGTWNIKTKSWSDNPATDSQTVTYAIRNFEQPKTLTYNGEQNEDEQNEDKSTTIIGDDSPAMLLPQSLTAWSPKDVKDKKGSNGAYISVLLRITMANPSGTHVVFPDPTASYTKIKDNNQNDYAWANIPISTVWKEGNCYTYTLNFLSGAGYDDEGEKILGDQIFFTTTVSEWTKQTNTLENIANQ